MLNERRESKRLDIFHVIEINSRTTLLGLIRNFSYQGFSFEMDSTDFEQKENIEFKLKHLQSNSSVSFIGDVVWEKWVANTFLAGIKLRKMDKKIKNRLIEILNLIRDTPIDLFNYSKNSEILKKERKEEKSEAILREKSILETSKNSKRKLIRNFIIGSFLILLGIITFKALKIPVSNTYYQTTPKELDTKEHLPKAENMLIKPFKDQADSKILDEDALSNKANETQPINTTSIIQVRSDNNIDTENTLNEKLKADDQYASRLVYTIQIKSQQRIADAQRQFNYILRSINGKYLDLLRIEKVTKYYTVRLGIFENYETAEKFLLEIRPRLSEAIILKAHIKNERIIRLHE
jgi:hypothetical protein